MRRAGDDVIACQFSKISEANPASDVAWQVIGVRLLAQSQAAAID
jgi:hypothetical protein